MAFGGAHLLNLSPGSILLNMVKIECFRTLLEERITPFLFKVHCILDIVNRISWMECFRTWLLTRPVRLAGI